MLYVIAWKTADHEVTYCSQWDDPDDATEAYLTIVHEQPDAAVSMAAALDLDHLRRMYPDLHGLPEVSTSVDPDHRLVLDADGGLRQVRRDET